MSVTRGGVDADRPRTRRRAAIAAPAVAAFLALAGCSLLPAPSSPAPDVELSTVPFFPQQAYHCGPASLATVLVASGVPVTPDALAPQVFVPGRQGSLQAELVAAARRRERLAVLLDGRESTLHSALAAGYPVLVLQNFGSRGRPQWHYAVVIGRERGRYLLRSGITERERLPARRFLATWDRADRWAMVVADPDAPPPAFVPAAAHVEAVAAWEAGGRDARATWRLTLQRWPDEPLALLGLATAELGAGEPREAERLYRAALGTAAAPVAAANNLSILVARRGCFDEARAVLDAAERSPSATRWRDVLAETRNEIEALARRPDAPRCDAPE